MTSLIHMFSQDLFKAPQFHMEGCLTFWTRKILYSESKPLGDKVCDRESRSDEDFEEGKMVINNCS